MFNRILRRIKDFGNRILDPGFCADPGILYLIRHLISRLFYLQIVKGDYYLENYKMQIRKTREIPGTRGNIYDRNGNLLAYNELAYSVTFEDTLASGSEKNQTLNKILEQVIEIVESHGDSVINSFGIVLDSAGNYQLRRRMKHSVFVLIADDTVKVYG